ncbi:hypothetical protein ILUMI_11817 [Ignelater luminosus]|uniref:Uncharacterized protein n=1 Tax=Ignelater luminosus TaxID=2038154 RepID=A0A8K0CZM3_IGNLU|nr:hypothetical protein ILUMI_11817 [Ignelater luminosus]
MFLFSGALCFPQFYQDDYDVKIERVELARYNTSYLKDVKFQYTFYNRTQKVLNASGHLLVDVGRDATVTVQFYKFASNEYRFFPVAFDANACHEVAHNTFNLGVMLKNTSNITPCHMKKGLYYIRNLAFNDFSHLPPHFLRGQFKMDAEAHVSSASLFEIHFYVTVSDKPPKWNKKQ